MKEKKKNQKGGISNEKVHKGSSNALRSMCVPSHLYLSEDGGTSELTK